MFGIKPKEDIFFELFISAAENARDAAGVLNDLLTDYNNIDSKINHIIDIEKCGDEIKYSIEKQLADTFITPFDREDIYLIAKKIDRFVNDTLTSALRFKMLHIDSVEEPAKEISSRLLSASIELITLFEGLKAKKKSNIIRESIIKINKYESEVDHIFREAITRLFDNPEDLLNIIKWKEIYQHLEDTADDCEDIANTIGGVVTKNE